MTECTDVMIVNIIIHMKDVIEDSISAAKSEIMAVNPLISDRVIEHVNFMSQKEVRRMERSELRIGQTVYIEPTGDAARNGKDIIETKISKIGTNWYHLNLTLDQLRRIKAIIEEGDSNESSSH